MRTPDPRTIPPPSLSDRGINTAVVLVERLGRALHAYGSSAHRLESALDLLSRRLGLEGQFFSTPTAIFASFRVARSEFDSEARTVLQRVNPGEVNLDKLSRLDAVLGQVIRGEIEPGDAISRVDAIVAQSPRYSAVVSFAAFAVAAGGAARFLGGGPRESIAAATIALWIGVLAWVTERLPNASRLYDALASLVAAFAATAAVALAPQLSFPIVTVAALIVLVPGLTLTLAMTELATLHLVSGAARMAGALLIFMTMGVGFAVGSELGRTLFGETTAWQPGPQPQWTEILALILTAGALLVLFRAHPRDYGWFLTAASVALVGARLGQAVLGPQLGALLGALVVGISSNLISRWRDRPAVITQMPGLMLLVPGSLGFRSVAAMVAQDTLSGIQTAFTVFLVAIALVSGLLLANVLVPPRKVL